MPPLLLLLLLPLVLVVVVVVEALSVVVTTGYHVTSFHKAGTVDSVSSDEGKAWVRNPQSAGVVAVA